MPNIEAKKQVVTEIREKLQRSKSAVLTDYRGLNVKEVTKLRNQLREAGIEYRVVKNTLATIAVKDIGLDELEVYLKGPTAIAFSDDPVAPAKILSEFAKTNKNFAIKGGVLEGKVIDLEGVKALADLPSREVLLAKVVGAMQAPITAWVNVLQGPIRKFVYALDAVRKQKEA
ncbi:MAG: 50S ribosomal protein L10 [Firmicutes bacterium]|nr:50S ribosomal protein L10 [Bacillota bacterium]